MRNGEASSDDSEHERGGFVNSMSVLQRVQKNTSLVCVTHVPRECDVLAGLRQTAVNYPADRHFQIKAFSRQGLFDTSHTFHTHSPPLWGYYPM